MRMIDTIPVMGSGLGYRSQLKKQIFAAKEEIDFVEVVTDQFLRGSAQTAELEEVCDHFPVIPHGVGLSIGSAAPPKASYLKGLKRISDLTGSPYYSEHLCLTEVPGIDLGHLSPLWFSEDLLKRTINHVNLVQDTLGKPLALENVTYTFEIPNPGMSQTEFFGRLVEATDCGVLLDITNVFINATNHGFSAADFMEAMPLDRVMQLHIAGGYWKKGKVVDGHSHPVQDETWSLLSLLAEKTEIKGIILEHDSNFPEIENLVTQVAKAREIGLHRLPA